MSFKKKYHAESLINENEEQVFELIEKICAEGEEKSVCACQDCILDIAAIALNNLQPNYRVFLVRPIHRDEEVVMVHLQKVEEAVRRAIATVEKRPHHDG